MLVLGTLVILHLASIFSLSACGDPKVTANRDAVANDLRSLSVRAQQYYRRPDSLQGGNNSFSGISMPHLTRNPSNANGIYSILSSSETQVTLQGVGRDIGNDGTNPVRVTATVFSDSIAFTVFN